MEEAIVDLHFLKLVLGCMSHGTDNRMQDLQEWKS